MKYVPIVCYVGTDGEKFYQYTMIEEATRERFIYAYKENSSYSTVDFVQRAIVYFGYAPDIIQTDNGGEFNHTQKTKRIHPLDVLCNKLHITHKTIRPATPWHNGKVERSHQERPGTVLQPLEFLLIRRPTDSDEAVLTQIQQNPNVCFRMEDTDPETPGTGGRPGFLLTSVGLRPPSVSKTDLLN